MSSSEEESSEDEDEKEDKKKKKVAVYFLNNIYRPMLCSICIGLITRIIGLPYVLIIQFYTAWLTF